MFFECGFSINSIWAGIFTLPPKAIALFRPTPTFSQAHPDLRYAIRCGWLQSAPLNFGSVIRFKHLNESYFCQAFLP